MGLKSRQVFFVCLFVLFAALIGWGIKSVFSSSPNWLLTEVKQEIYIMNCDGVWHPESSGGYGALIRDGRGEGIAAVAGKSKSVDITFHELQGVEAGLKLAKSYGIRRIEARTDNEAVYGLLEKRNFSPTEVTVDILNRIKEMRKQQLQDFKIIHISNKANGAADFLSRLLPDTEYLEMSPSKFPDGLKEIINKEKERFLLSLQQG